MSNTARPEPNPFDRFDPLPVDPLAKVAPAAPAMVPGGFRPTAQSEPKGLNVHE